MTPEVKQRIEQIRQGDMPAGYKKTVSGIAPTAWTDTCLGDIYTERKEPGNESLPLLMVSIHSGVSDGEVDEDDLPKKVKRIEDKSQYKRAATGDLVFNMMRAWQGAIGTVRTEGMVSPAYIVAEPNDTVDPLFMDYYMKTDRMVYTIHRQSYGVTDFRLRLYWDSFAPIKCTLPPVAEQQKIAAILTTQDKVIELKEKQLAEKQRQKKYLMQQLLTGKKRLPGFGGEWKTKKLGNTCTIQRGGSPRPIESYITEGEGINWIKIGDTSVDSKYITATKERIIEAGVIKSRCVHTGDFLLSNSMSYGRPYILKVAGCIHDGWLVISDYDKLFDMDFLYYLLSSEFVQRQYDSLAAGSGVHNLNIDLVSNVSVILPSLTEQVAIAKILSIIDGELDLLRQNIEQEQQKKRALMQLLLTGIVRVKNGK